MLQIDDKLISLDVLQERFVCDLDKCKGACCVEGDSGAPLEESEANALVKDYASIKPFLNQKGIQSIELQGVSMIDSDGDVVTPLVNNKECAYVVFDNDIAKCGIEQAFLEGKASFRKPVSCYLYPIRTKRYSQFTAVNYDEWDICKPAKELGKEKNVRVHEFVSDALQQKFGEEWCKQLKIAAVELEKQYFK
ncbi:MAG: DUF3109 family protein [Bacteroidales bacterium]|nr:DUF3109 family protein [Bacteroidales bacterium]